MIVIADNLNTRNKAFMEAVKDRDRDALAELSRQLSKAGAEMINIQCSLDGDGDREALPWAAEIIQQETDLFISLDTRDPQVIKDSISVLKNPPLINYLSLDEPGEEQDRQGLLQLIEASGASLVIRASKGVTPSTLEGKLQITEALIEAANAADIANEKLFADPSIVHMTGSSGGQRGLLNSSEYIRVLKDIVEPPINTIVWVSNVSAGLPQAVRKPLEAAFLLYAAGSGLDAAMLDVLDENVRKAAYMVKSFRDETVFTAIELQ